MPNPIIENEHMRTRGAAKTAFIEALKRQRPLLLDGGLATQLEAQGCDLDNTLWSASILLDDPQAIVDAGLAYLEAGAECIATASYQASREGFAKLGHSADEADRLMLLSVELAVRARDGFAGGKAGARPLVAASIGPYGAMLHDGSEYTGNYGVSNEALRLFHEERLQLFDGSEADVLAVETIPSLPEARVLAELLGACDTPAWISFSCRNGRQISDGTPLAEVAALFAGHPTVVAVGINCTPPQYATALIRILRETLPDKALVVYPNSGEKFNVSDNAWSGDVVALTAAEWVEAGAKLIGGCCRVGPDQIRAMAAGLMEN